MISFISSIFRKFLISIIFFLSSSIILINYSIAENIKIGFINIERILNESVPAKIVQTKIELEFKKRDEELQDLNNNLSSQLQLFDKNSLIMTESDRLKQQRILNNLDIELQRKRNEFQEDLNRRRNEEFSSILIKANDSIKHIAEKENYDLIIQDAVTVNTRIDITDQVIKSLE
ncbi:MAG: OmpH family outer membrane protein [Bordetella sp.]|nr:MAG: OmpH family outer membrane protein [Bordetella sp.]